MTIPPSSLPPHVQPAPQDTRPSASSPPPVGAALTAVVPQIPSVALNTEKGVVVIDFRNDSGAVINSIPTAQQLAAYAASQPPPAAPAPPEGTSPPANTPRSARSAKHQ